MKPEPLTKEKILKRKVDIDKYLLPPLWYWVRVIDVKSAVQWLLKEMDKKREEISELENIGDRNISLLWLDWFEDLVKEAFSGVLEGGDNN